MKIGLLLAACVMVTRPASPVIAQRSTAGFAFQIQRVAVEALRVPQMFDERLQSLRCDHPPCLIELGVHEKEVPQSLQEAENKTLLPVEKSQSKHVPIQVVRQS